MVRLCLGLLVTMLTACLSPPEATVNLRTPYGTVLGLSTEEGILALRDLVGEDQESISFRYFVGNGRFDDDASIKRVGPSLALLAPASSQPNQARLGDEPARSSDELYVEARNADGVAELLEVALYDGGRSGDLLIPDDGEVTDLAQQLMGSGVFAYREGHLQVVGILNGVYCESPASLAFIGLNEIAGNLPTDSSYFERKAYPRRADFEYGRPRDLEGEVPFAAGLEPAPTYDPEAEEEAENPPQE